VGRWTIACVVDVVMGPDDGTDRRKRDGGRCEKLGDVREKFECGVDPLCPLQNRVARILVPAAAEKETHGQDSVPSILSSFHEAKIE